MKLYSIVSYKDVGKKVFNLNFPNDGEISYPHGKEIYDDYMKEKQIEYKRKKLEKILNKD